MIKEPKNEMQMAPQTHLCSGQQVPCTFPPHPFLIPTSEVSSWIGPALLDSSLLWEGGIVFPQLPDSRSEPRTSLTTQSFLLILLDLPTSTTVKRPCPQPQDSFHTSILPCSLLPPPLHGLKFHHQMMISDLNLQTGLSEFCHGSSICHQQGMRPQTSFRSLPTHLLLLSSPTH